MFKQFLFFILLSIICFSIPAASDTEKEKPLFTEQITIIGDVELNKSVQSITVYSKQQLKQMSFFGLQSIFNQTAGLTSLTGGHYGQVNYSFARGASVNQTLVLIDGIKISDPSTSLGLNLSFTPASLFGRAEIVRGPLSNIYGSNAMGGVINLMTREDNALEASAFLGSYGSYQGNLYIGRQLGKNFRLVVNANHANYTDNVENDLFQSSGINIKAEYKKEKFRLKALFFASSADSGIPFNLGKPSLQRKYSQENILLAVPVVFQLNKNLKLDLKLSHNSNNYQFEDPDDPYFYTSARNRSLVNNFTATVKTRISDMVQLTGGFDFSDQKILSESVFSVNVDNQKTHYYSLFFNGDISLRKFMIFGSFRFDKYQDLDAAFSPQLGISFLIGDHIKLRSSYSGSFRAPILTELLDPLYGNPELDPETGTSFELGADIYTRSLTISLVYFDSAYKNLIGYNFNTWKMDNLIEADISGLEIGEQ